METKRELLLEVKILNRLQNRLEGMINLTPTGSERNKLTEENILLLKVCKEKEEYLSESFS